MVTTFFSFSFLMSHWGILPLNSCLWGTTGREWKSLQSEWESNQLLTAVAWTDVTIRRYNLTFCCGHNHFNFHFLSLSVFVTMVTRAKGEVKSPKQGQRQQFKCQRCSNPSTFYPENVRETLWIVVGLVHMHDYRSNRLRFAQGTMINRSHTRLH